MAIVDLFSRRRRRELGLLPDIYVYDAVPNRVRVQVVHIVRDALGDNYQGTFAHQVYRDTRDILRREYGRFRLVEYPENAQQEVFDFFLQTKSIEECLDVVELFCKILDYQHSSKSDSPEDEPAEPVREINQRFKEAGIGYEFVAGEIIRIDSELVHADVIKPALALLHTKRFAGANQEFLAAHEHYRHGRHKEALVDALKSLESVMKVICADRKWVVPPNATAKTLITTCIQNGLIAPQNESYVSATRSILESGLPPVRNKHGGHGQGPSPTIIPPHVVQFALHQSAACILLLVNSDQPAT